MNMRDISTPKSTLLPALVAVILLCLAGAAVLTLLTHGASPAAAPASEAPLILQRLPFEAQNALRGEATAFDALAKSVARINGLRSALTDDKTPDPAWNKLTDAASKVTEARKAVETIGAANQEAREIAPKLLSELGDLMSAVGVQKLEGMSRYLERFELTVTGVERVEFGRRRRRAHGAAAGGQPRIPQSGDARPLRRGVRPGADPGDRQRRGAAPEDGGAAESAVRNQCPQGDWRRRIVVESAGCGTYPPGIGGRPGVGIGRFRIPERHGGKL